MNYNIFKILFCNAVLVFNIYYILVFATLYLNFGFKYIFRLLSKINYKILIIFKIINIISGLKYISTIIF